MKMLKKEDFDLSNPVAAMLHEFLTDEILEEVQIEMMQRYRQVPWLYPENTPEPEPQQQQQYRRRSQGPLIVDLYDVLYKRRAPEVP